MTCWSLIVFNSMLKCDALTFVFVVLMGGEQMLEISVLVNTCTGLMVLTSSNEPAALDVVSHPGLDFVMHSGQNPDTGSPLRLSFASYDWSYTHPPTTSVALHTVGTFNSY